jgi:hypothetical protein
MEIEPLGDFFSNPAPSLGLSEDEIRFEQFFFDGKVVRDARSAGLLA